MIETRGDQAIFGVIDNERSKVIHERKILWWPSDEVAQKVKKLKKSPREAIAWHALWTSPSWPDDWFYSLSIARASPKWIKSKGTAFHHSTVRPHTFSVIRQLIVCLFALEGRVNFNKVRLSNQNEGKRFSWPRTTPSHNTIIHMTTFQSKSSYGK